ncbi:hypothetical protein DFJ58DRAFT_845575 [Suillus subalutaceus]|uniref:uncharacterized protein n=1 Tax=Suillus subalutaceus TaxID=48586 RepID=UPI001B88535E|nr:uncharacterized protein DFJ58DRAFT_845575 [Suillus subalutaceus]KAG1839820.1 hypothetical protein DFJ58DRAFT_845575 [Suillus subalutaceus]
MSSLHLPTFLHPYFIAVLRCRGKLRKLQDGDDVMEFKDDTMEFRDNAMKLDSKIFSHCQGCTTTATSVMAIKKLLVLQSAKKARSEPATTQTLTIMTKVPCPAKKVKSELTSKTLTIAAVPAVQESMLADMAIKPVAGNVNWTIGAADLLCAMQAICNTMYPGVKYNIQPRGPIMGVRSCTWCSNFGFTAIALITNFWASLRENPNTCKASEIYRSVFMLQMIAMTHLNTVAGFIDDGCVIGTCAVALKHALKSVTEKEKKSTDLKTPLKINKSTSKESSTPLAFSKLNWGQFMTDYHLSIVKHGPKYMTDTIAMAYQFVKNLGSDASTKGSLADNSVASSRGEQALLSFIKISRKRSRKAQNE